jgi:hypothetical protein
LTDIVGVYPGRSPGFYHINVVPIRTETWKSGVNIFAIAAINGKDQGQTLATVFMD